MNLPRPGPVALTLLIGASLGAALIAWHRLPPVAYVALAAVYALLAALAVASERRPK